MKHIFLILLTISFLGCSETDNEKPASKICLDNPLENIEWLKKLINNTDSNGTEVIQYNYKNQTVFSINNCLNCSDNLITVYDCQRNKICEFGGITGLNTCPDFDTEATNKTTLFSDRFCDKGAVISSSLYKELKASPIASLNIEGNCLTITFNILSTQDPIKDVDLIDSGEILESFPVQRKLKFSVEESLTKPTTILATTSFNISNLAKKGETVLLNIDGYNDSIKYTRTF